jgi:glycosyltransferase involved in cell wall biosynthesis
VALGLPRAARRRLREFRPDILHIATADILGYQALRFGLKRKFPIVASYHARWEKYLEHYRLGFLSGLLTRYFRHFYGACREVYVPSASMTEVLIADGLRDNFRLWTRGVDTEHFSPGKRSDRWRHAHDIGPAEVAVLFVSRIVREKQTGLLVDTLRNLTAAGIPHRAVIVGDGPELDDLKKQLPDGVFTGFLQGEDLAAAYASCDIFLFPSDTETFGNVTLEAMASGLPCVCADATGSRSLVEPDVTGYLARPGDAAQFANYVAQLAKDEDLRRRMGEMARERSLTFTWDSAMGHLLGHYEALLGSPDEQRASS